MTRLDCNHIVGAVRSGTPQAARVDVRELCGEPLRVSAIAWAEVLGRPLTPLEKVTAASLLGPPVPVTADDAAKAAELFNLARRRRGSLADCLIAAAALRGGAAVATDNRSDFAAFAAAGFCVVP